MDLGEDMVVSQMEVFLVDHLGEGVSNQEVVVSFLVVAAFQVDHVVEEAYQVVDASQDHLAKVVGAYQDEVDMDHMGALALDSD